ncbi:MAG: bifunctional 4-hydroxy-2-oxoglutarate aldolase/2-dehydro-3-deoxy-phosphogluconate aldolase [Parvularculaceae bacterium]
MRIDDILARATVMPVLEIAELDSAAPLATALLDGGVDVIELTMRTDCALEALRAAKATQPDMVIGMGTIRTPNDVEEALAAGADFLVSPGAGPALLDALAQSGAPALPGVATASEAMAASEAGFDAMKLFPAEAVGGVALLKSLAGPLPNLRFCPTGGVSAELAPTYLALPNVACVGGSWIATRQMIADGDFETIRKNAERAAAMGAG